MLRKFASKWEIHTQIQPPINNIISNICAHPRVIRDNLPLPIRLKPPRSGLPRLRGGIRLSVAPQVIRCEPPPDPSTPVGMTESPVLC